MLLKLLNLLKLELLKLELLKLELWLLSPEGRQVFLECLRPKLLLHY